VRNFLDGTSDTIASVLSTTHLTVSTSRIIGAGAIRINRQALSVTGTTVQIGSSTTDTNQVNLQLDSYSTYADSGTCTTTSNQGAMYYNSNSAAIRGCVNGSWEDMVTTSGLGLIAFGVLPDTGPTQGDLVGANGVTNSPCKVTRVSATSVAVSACTVYSQGRKQVYGGSTLTGLTGNNWYHVCFSSTTTTAPIATLAATEVAGFTGTTAFSANNPVLCVADVKMTGSTMTQIYDTRVYTTSVKSFATVAAATPLGTVVKQSGTLGQFSQTTAATDAAIGVVVATSGVSSTTTPNAIIVTAGAVWVKAAATSTLGQFVTPSTTTGYTNTTTTTPAVGAGATAYNLMGIALSTLATSCTSQSTILTDCQTSQFVQMTIR
jgi:hypothetical protein